MPPESRDPAQYYDMLMFARDAAKVGAGRSRTDLTNDLQFRLAVERIIELVGEAARLVSDDGKARHPEIPWRRVVGARNILAHDYGSIDYDVLWTILKDGIPDLIAKLEPIVAALPPPK
jgi:uncharacterized protein with HEPN domain